jgi:hypothetical protein
MPDESPQWDAVDRKRWHDLAGSLNTMSLALQILASGQAAGPADAVEWLDAVIDAADRALLILDNEGSAVP